MKEGLGYIGEVDGLARGRAFLRFDFDGDRAVVDGDEIAGDR